MSLLVPLLLLPRFALLAMRLHESYLFAIALSEWGMSPGAAIAFSFLAVIAYAAVLGALIVRTNPLAFMMLTLAAGEMIRSGDARSRRAPSPWRLPICQ